MDSTLKEKDCENHKCELAANPLIYEFTAAVWRKDRSKALNLLSKQPDLMQNFLDCMRRSAQNHQNPEELFVLLSRFINLQLF